MHKLVRRVLITILGVVLAFACSGFLFVHGANRKAKANVLELSDRLEHLRLGDPFTDDLQTLLRTHDAQRTPHIRLPDGTLEPIHDICANGADEWYSVNLSPFSSKWQERLSAFYRTGLIHRWGAGLTLYVKDEKVLCVTESVSFINDGRSDLYIVFSNAELVPSPRNGELWNENYRVEAGTTKARMLHVTALLGATEEQLQGLFKVNLDCTTSFQPCAYPCQILPSVWRQYAKMHHSAQWPGPPDEDEGRCAAIASKPD